MTEQCPELADDGAQCQREYGDHVEHDFSAQSHPSAAVDGGRKWSDWIKMVHAVRELLMPQATDKDMGKEGRVDEWPEAYCREILIAVAMTVDLKVEGNPRVIRE